MELEKKGVDLEKMSVIKSDVTTEDAVEYFTKKTNRVDVDIEKDVGKVIQIGVISDLTWESLVQNGTISDPENQSREFYNEMTEYDKNIKPVVETLCRLSYERDFLEHLLSQ